MQSSVAALLQTVRKMRILPEDASLHVAVLEGLKALSSEALGDTDDDTAALADLLAAPGASATWNTDLLLRFMSLRGKDGPPALYLANLLIECADTAGMGETHPLMPLLLMAAALGGVPSVLPFHSHHHIREVTALSCALSRAAHKIHPFANPHRDMCEIWIAACIHDFAHDGQGNRRHGKYTPMRLERRALDKAEPYLKTAGLPQESWDRIRVMVLATDVSKISPLEGMSPSEWLRRAIAGEQPDKTCPPELLPLFADLNLRAQAALLEDADLCTSAGMPYEFARRMTMLIAQETEVLSASPETLIGFLEHICHGEYITDAARAIFGDNIKALRLQAEKEKFDTLYRWA